MANPVSRRTFIASTSAAATAFALFEAPGRAASQAGILSPTTTQPNPEWKGKAVLDLTRSPHAKLKQVPVGAVTITGFWARRRQTNVASSIPSMRQELVEHGCMDNFLRLSGKSQAAQTGPVYSDSDIYKWVESVGFVLQSQDAPELRKTTDAMIRDVVTLWHDLSEHQMYVTGGVGARSEGEAFGNPYELPNERAYGESCAAIGNMMWNARMLAGSGEARFADVIERALYNGINSGMSLDGKLYCYRNPLAFEPKTGDVIRNPWYDTTCCPPNLERTFASLPGYFYSTGKDGVYVHLYDASEMNWHLEDGTGIKLVQQTNYPWAGDVQLTVSPAQPREFTVYLRIPGWSAKNTVRVNGKAVEGARPGEYLAIRRHWSAGDQVDLAMDMTPQLIEANPSVADDVGKLVLQRGPIVFCMEELDQAIRTEQVNLGDYLALKSNETKASFDAALLDGVVVLEHPGTLRPADKLGLYYAAGARPSAENKTMLRLIPYYAWANRERSPMQVWIPYQQA